MLAIPPDGVRQVWPMAEPCLAKATAVTKKITTEDIYNACLVGRMQLWLAVEGEQLMMNALGSGGTKEPAKIWAALATDLQLFPSGWKVCRLLVCGGTRMWRWKQAADDTLTAYAETEGCNALEIVGMEDWENVFPGAVKIETVFSKELSHG